MSNYLDNLSVNDFGKICRTCLAQGEMKHLYQNCFESECLVEMLMSVTFVQVTEKDGLPAQICLNCEKKLISAYNFAQKCLEIDKTLKNISKNTTKTEIIRPETPKNFEVVVVKPENVDNNIDNSDSEINNEEIVPESPKVERVKKTKKYGPPFECKKCFKVYPTFKFLWMHWQQAKHPRNARTNCKICSKTIQCSKLNMHMKIHTNEQPYCCDVCGKKFTSKNNLSRHFRIHTGEKPYKCPHCVKAFNQSNTLKDHIRTHTGETPYVCNYCGKGFTAKGYLIFHLRTHEGKHKPRSVKNGSPSADRPGSPQFECNICNRKYTTKPLLNQHAVIHGEKKFLCSDCGRGFFSKPALDSHSKTHTGLKPYKCKTCNKQFSQLGSLRSHNLIHTGAKPYVCNICNRSFTQRHHVTYHLRTHTGERPHSCSICGKTFALNGNLTVHMRTHTGETPYLCDICGKGFYDSSSMKKHKLGHDKPLKTK